jgi:hypothetical protein
VSIDSDLAAAYAETFGTVSVVYGATSKRGFYTEHDEVVQGEAGDVVVRFRWVDVLVAEFPFATVTLHSSITVDGRSYKVRDKQLVNDGREMRVYLAEE